MLTVRQRPSWTDIQGTADEHIELLGCVTDVTSGNACAFQVPPLFSIISATLRHPSVDERRDELRGYATSRRISRRAPVSRQRCFQLLSRLPQHLQKLPTNLVTFRGFLKFRLCGICPTQSHPSWKSTPLFLRTAIIRPVIRSVIRSLSVNSTYVKVLYIRKGKPPLSHAAGDWSTAVGGDTGDSPHFPPFLRPLGPPPTHRISAVYLSPPSLYPVRASTQSHIQALG